MGEFEIQADDKDNPGQKSVCEKYGLKAFSPIAKGYGFSHYDDFRQTAGLMGLSPEDIWEMILLVASGTPIIAGRIR